LGTVVSVVVVSVLSEVAFWVIINSVAGVAFTGLRGEGRTGKGSRDEQDAEFGHGASPVGTGMAGSMDLDAHFGPIINSGISNGLGPTGCRGYTPFKRKRY
jgi:hypothetical protein